MPNPKITYAILNVPLINDSSDVAVIASLDICDNQKLKFIVDTGATCSFIKYDDIRRGTLVTRDDSKFYGLIKDQFVTAIGKVTTTIYLNEIGLKQTFYIIQDEVNITNNGILGADFLRAYKAEINYSSTNMTLQINVTLEPNHKKDASTNTMDSDFPKTTLSSTALEALWVDNESNDPSLNHSIKENEHKQDTSLYKEEINHKTKNFETTLDGREVHPQEKNLCIDLAKSTNELENETCSQSQMKTKEPSLNKTFSEENKESLLDNNEPQLINESNKKCDSETEQYDWNNFTVEFTFDKETIIEPQNKGNEKNKIKEEPPSTNEPNSLIECSKQNNDQTQSGVQTIAKTAFTDPHNLLTSPVKNLNKKPTTRKKARGIKKTKKISNKNFYKELASNYFEKYPKVKPSKEPNFHFEQNTGGFDYFQLEELENLENKNLENENNVNNQLFSDENKVENEHTLEQNKEKKSTLILHNQMSKDNLYEACPIWSTKERVKYLRENISLAHCSEEEQNEMLKIFNRFSTVFQLPGDTFRHTDIDEHQIVLKPDTNPINQRQFRIPEHYRGEIQRQIRELEKNGIISRCDSPWNSPIFLVPKKPNDKGEKQYRLVIDYRELNKVIKPTSFPMPLIDEIIDKMNGSKYFTTLDLFGAYHQIRLEENSRQYTAFSTSWEKYCFNSIPFGLVSSPYAWLKVIHKVLMEQRDDSPYRIGKGVFVYMDDIIVYSKNLEEHLCILKDIMERFEKHFLKLKVDKSKFLAKEVAYLGFILTTEGLKADPRKTECIRKYPRPKNVKQVQSFMGLCNYYRRYIEDYAGLARPLYNLCRKDELFEWNDKCEESFKQFKEKLTTPPILIFPNFNQPFILRTDCSMLSASGVLSQGEIGHDLPIHYHSKVLNPAQTRYSVIERELLAIILCIEYFHYYLVGREFLIVTDHRPLTYLFSTKNISARLHRWRYLIMSYQFKIIYKSGKSNVVADALSRIQVETDESEADNPRKIDHDMLKFSKAKICIQTRAQKEKQKEQEEIKELEKIQELEEIKELEENEEREKTEPNLDVLIHPQENKHNVPTNPESPKEPRQIHFIRERKNIVIKSNEYDYIFYIIQKVDDILHRKIQHKLKKSIDLQNVNYNELFSLGSDQSIIMSTTRFRSDAELLIARTMADMILKFFNEKGVENIAINIQFNDPISHFEFKQILYQTFKYSTIALTFHLNEIIEVMTVEDIDKILYMYHNSIFGGHNGVEKTKNSIKNFYYWPNMNNDIKMSHM